MPSVLTIEFGRADGRRLDLATVRPSGLHAFLSARFEETAKEHTDVKGYSLGVIQAHGDGVVAEVRCGHDGLAAAIAGLPVGHPLRFGGERGGMLLCDRSRAW
jgi:hypothetical protein